ncbi:MAG: hypothetical protein HY823_15765 [Acidobacteria bacterium]|nr:hypothetical protein [Acidobacteriota bacterium]
MLRAHLGAFLILGLLGCSSEDPRLPVQIYEEAFRLNQQGKMLEAKSLMEQLIQQYPESPSALQARKDLISIESMIKRDISERQKEARAAMRRVSDALARFKGKKGEYPAALAELVPEYLDRVPEAPWGHPFLYRAFVGVPIEDVKDRRGNLSQKMNTKLDRFYLACLGTDLGPGGKGLEGDILVVDGEPYEERSFPPIPTPQPLR